jgi:hypothetical protein
MQPSHAAPHAFREQKQQADGLFSDRLPAVFAVFPYMGLTTSAQLFPEQS